MHHIDQSPLVSLRIGRDTVKLPLLLVFGFIQKDICMWVLSRINVIQRQNHHSGLLSCYTSERFVVIPDICQV